ncbi:uncharacterized protein LOC131990739 [Centropristis striata]|uniref:uncharacterized protein LOC131990739 n=1 Tax=Centropristis striata TaxID=184440 RepID=UPI0027DFCDE5|nr:uncharacterized protein LOC131990739 [Centropristis striata]
MVELRWMIFFVMLQFAVTGLNVSYIMARYGDEVTLPCDNVIENQNQCNQTSWFYSRHEGNQTEDLISLGQIGKSEIAEAKSNRLSVTADCSLVRKDVTHTDVGRYSCRQFNRAGHQQGGDALVVLSVIFSEYLHHNVFSSNCLVRITYRDIILIMITVMKLISLFSLFSLIISQSSPVNEKQNGDQTTFECYVFTHGGCEHTVQWLFDGNNNDVETTAGSCSASVTFPTRYLSQKLKIYESLKCNVTDHRSGETLLFSTVTGLNVSYIMARDRDKVTLPCDNVIENQNQCNQTSWLHSPERGRSAEELISLGQIGKSEMTKAKSNRLSVTADCSLVIKDVTYQDVGRYSCRQFNRAGQQQGEDALVVLSVIYIQWLFDGNFNDTETTAGSCSARVTFPTPHPSQKSKFYESLKCNVTDNRSEKTLLFQSSLEKTATGSVSPWWRIIIVLVGLAAVIAAVVLVNIWIRTKGNQTLREDNVEPNDEDEDEGTVMYESGAVYVISSVRGNPRWETPQSNADSRPQCFPGSALFCSIGLASNHLPPAQP